ncbi:MAG: isoprenyl transferase [Candidatus Melainabacteria bacterium]|nr:MAG: isoprenyl transferase [Candidatus Melainabacteria bacterium]
METKKIENLVKQNNLQHIAVIMDGNRRWAKLHNLPSAFGHKKGVDSLKKVVRACDDFGIKYLTVYAFSTENWHRTKEEVSFLMNLLAKTLGDELDELHQNNVVIRFLGDISQLSKKLQDVVSNAEEKTKNNSGVNLQIAFNYGARDEILKAVKSISKKVLDKKLNIDDITEDTISNELYTKDIPNPDLLIRTGGEKRISNYLLWQIAYSEILVVDEFWPEFDKNSLAKAVEEFNLRNRRFGE